MPHPKLKPTRCSNCGMRLFVSHNYCPRCGQENHDLNIPLWHLIEEATENIFHYDTKSIQTLKAICFKPGYITSEFMRGKRIEYVTPIRLYIFVSFMFFLVLSLPQGSSLDVKEKTNITLYGVYSRDLRNMQQAQLDSVMRSRAIAPSQMNKYLMRQLSRIGTDGIEEFNHKLVKGISYMMFVLMPLFALFIFLLNQKKTKYYIGTLVFSLHYHSFVFLLLTLSLLMNRIFETPITLVVPIIVSPIYLLLALKSVYEDSILRTILKTMLVGILQFVSMVILFLSTVLIILLII